MILSFHPCVVADENRLCAGRDPDAADEAALRRAAAAILPQGCHSSLWQMARSACAHVFPDYEARFRYPGKCGQIRLFRALQAPHPASAVFDGSETCARQPLPVPPFEFPLVFKFDWGGEGEGVERIAQPQELARLVARAAASPAGDRGFLLQEPIPCGGRSLRVAVIGRQLRSYWRVAPPGAFRASLAHGGRIEQRAAPHLQRRGREAVARCCAATGIDLAGFDLLFDERQGRDATPLLLEINWFFGREGLGGSSRFYRLLRSEIRAWLAERGLCLKPCRQRSRAADTPGEDDGPGPVLP